MNSKKVLRMLMSDGWYISTSVGSHTQLKHPNKAGKVTVPHPRKDLPIGTLRSIQKQSGVKLV